MQPLPSATAALIAQRIGLVFRTLIWVSARNRSSSATQTLGLWNGDDDTTITIDGQARLYYGADGLVSTERLSARTGLEVMTVRAILAPLAPRGRDVVARQRHAPCAGRHPPRLSAPPHPRAGRCPGAPAEGMGGRAVDRLPDRGRAGQHHPDHHRQRPRRQPRAGRAGGATPFSPTW